MIKFAKLIALMVNKKGVEIGVPFAENETKLPVPSTSLSTEVHAIKFPTYGCVMICGSVNRFGPPENMSQH